MSQPPYPPEGGSSPGEEDPGHQRWEPPGGANQPTQPFGAPPGQWQRQQTQQFGPPPYGQQPYAQQPYYGPPPYGQQPPYAPPPTGRNGTVIALVVAGVVLLAVVGIGLFLLLRNDDGPSTVAADPSTAQSSSASSSDEQSTSGSASSSASGDDEEIPAATVPPDGLGDDVIFDALAQGCYDGDMTACDALFQTTEDDESVAAYNQYADTCAGRQPAGTSVFCTDAFPS
jgi:hypothetical protein